MNDRNDMNHAFWQPPAAEKGHADMAWILLEAGADRNAKNEADQTALDLAQANGHDALAALLRAPAG